MRVITLNVNGIRAAARKGMYEWLASQNADLICLQEVRARTEQLKQPIFRPAGYHLFWHAAQRAGYSGVAVYSRNAPDLACFRSGIDALDSEGRLLELRFPDFDIASFYMPSGSANEQRQAAKFDTMRQVRPLFESWAARGRELLICGDWNIAHREIDLKNWKSNQKNSGFLPEERSWLGAIFDELGWVDVVRHLLPETPVYTWWSNRGRAWENDVGWRIDYQIATPALAQRAANVSVYREQRFSDHAPVIVDYD